MICIDGGKSDSQSPSSHTPLQTSDLLPQRIDNVWERFKVAAWGVEWMDKRLFEAAVRELLK